MHCGSTEEEIATASDGEDQAHATKLIFSVFSGQMATHSVVLVIWLDLSSNSDTCSYALSHAISHMLIKRSMDSIHGNFANSPHLN